MRSPKLRLLTIVQDKDNDSNTQTHKNETRTKRNKMTQASFFYLYKKKKAGIGELCDLDDEKGNSSRFYSPILMPFPLSFCFQHNLFILGSKWNKKNMYNKHLKSFTLFKMKKICICVSAKDAFNNNYYNMILQAFVDLIFFLKTENSKTKRNENFSLSLSLSLAS